jgi:hypothetical protein
MKEYNFKLGQTVYHRNVYDHREPLKIVGIRENELELEGDYSGGTNIFCEKDWLPITGVSRIYNHVYKKECRDYVIKNKKLIHLIKDKYSVELLNYIEEVYDMILNLTNDVHLNPEY